MNIVGFALRYLQVWAWYLGVIYMAGMFSLGIYLSIEHFIYILHGNFLPPVFLLFSVFSLPSLFLLFRRNMGLLQHLRNADVS